MNYVDLICRFIAVALGIASFAGALVWAGFDAPWWVAVNMTDFPARGLALWILHIFTMILGLVNLSWLIDRRWY